MTCWRCQGRGEYLISRFIAWAVPDKRGYLGGYKIVAKRCDCGAKK